MCLLFSCWNPPEKSSWMEGGGGGVSDSKCGRNKLATLNQGEKGWDGVSLALTLSLMLESECFHQLRLSSHPTMMWASQTVYCLMAKRLDTFSGRLQKVQGPCLRGLLQRSSQRNLLAARVSSDNRGGGFQFAVQKGIPAQGLGTCPLLRVTGNVYWDLPFRLVSKTSLQILP